MSDRPQRLLIQSGANAGREYELTAPSITIGRYPLADIVIDDPDIAYRHALLTRSDRSYRIADLVSESGTYVNGHRVGAEPVDLAHGDIILLGSRLSTAYLEHPIEPVAGEEGATATLETGVRQNSYDAPVSANEFEENDEVSDNEYEPPALETDPAALEAKAMAAERPAFVEPATHEAHHPGPLPAMPPTQKNKNGRILLITIGCLIALLACCCSSTLFMYFIGGDWLLRLLGY